VSLFSTLSGIRVRPALIAFGLGALMVVEGCASGGGTENPFDGPLNTETVILEVRSQNRYDTEIYIVPGGRREHVATIPSGGFQVYEFQWPPGVPLIMELQLSVAGRHRLPPFSFSGVDRLVLIVAPDLTKSTLRR
jgi:hypothetical protein